MPQRSYVVENPESATVRGDGDIVAFDNQIADGTGRKIEAKGSPGVTVVERKVHAALGSGEEQAFAAGIFADDVDDLALGDSGDDLLPGFPGIARAVDVRPHVVKSQRVDGGIS